MHNTDDVDTTITPKQITLANLASSTCQEVFDWIVYNLLRQNKRSVDNEDFCAYRGFEGTKCAAGWVISDDEYNPDFEGNSWVGLVAYQPIGASNFHEIVDIHDSLISKLQNIHDNSQPDRWLYRFNELATKYNLNDHYLREWVYDRVK